MRASAMLHLLLLLASSCAAALHTVTASAVAVDAPAPLPGPSSPATDLILPIPVTPGDASSCGVSDVFGGTSATLDPLNADLPPGWTGPAAAAACDAPGWVFCINAECADEPSAKPDLYGGKPFVACSCWQPTNTNFSILPLGPDSGANCVLGQDTFAGGAGGEGMCQAIRDGALISTYGPGGDMRGGTPIDDAQAPFSLQSAECRPNTPWAWCWGAPCELDPTSPTGITCHCPYMTSTNDAVQSISLAGQQACDVDPCAGPQIYNSMPAGQSPNTQPPCATQQGA